METGNYPGLSYISSNLFRVPWKHNSRKDCNDEDCKIFRVGRCFDYRFRIINKSVFYNVRTPLHQRAAGRSADASFPCFPLCVCACACVCPCVCVRGAQAWAVASGKIHEFPNDKAKWKTNFRCALKNLNKRFRMTKDNSKISEDPHKIYEIISRETTCKKTPAALCALRSVLTSAPCRTALTLCFH